uniref:NADH dehydrogenase subunit 5 n=1 Tax=Phyllodoce medipapillata TaxID=868040 RepID=UPI0030FE89BA
MNFSYSVAFFYSRLLMVLMSIVFFLSLYFCYSMKLVILEWNMLSLYGLDIIMPIVFDPMGLFFSFVVLFISMNVVNFAHYYMEGEVFMKRFIHLVMLFVLSMNFLIYIPHLMGLLLGWDGLGIVSFVLVIYYQNPKSLAAGMITALSNRVGDVMLLLSIGWSLNQGHWHVLNMDFISYSNFIIFSIMIAAMTKSAQIPFSSWLPAAMAAPTPVSALVHSSTLVTAGVFLLIRFYPYLSKIVYFNQVILIIASMTMFMAGVSALVESDMKKIVALSTLSQLGVMMSAIGLGLPFLAYFHLITHALFKALLFVCVGTLINLHHHNQDLRVMGNLSSQMPLTMTCLNIANMALCGLPFMSGFYSKDLIIEMMLFNSYSYVVILLFVVATMMTAAYSIRLMFTGLISMSMGMSMQYVDDNSTSNTSPMIMLSIGAVFGGCLMNWMMMSPLDEPILSYSMKLMAFFITVFGGCIMAYVILFKYSLSYYTYLLHDSSAMMWFMVPMSTQMMLKFPMKLGSYSLKIMDQGWVESFGAQGIFIWLSSIFKKYQLWQNSMITVHLSMMLLFLFVIM